MAGIAAPIELDQQEQGFLRNIIRSKTLGVVFQERAQIVLAAAEKRTNLQIQKEYGLEEHRIAIWRNRFFEAHETWKQLDPDLRPAMSKALILAWLADRKGRGRKPTITPEQKALILAVACESPSKSGYPNTHWTDRLLAREVVKRGIVEYIAFQTVWSFLKDKRPETAQNRVLPEIG